MTPRQALALLVLVVAVLCVLPGDDDLNNAPGGVYDPLVSVTVAQ